MTTKVHTHPNRSPEPSSIDERTSRLRGVPVYVVTRSRITKTNGGRPVTVARGDWNPAAVIRCADHRDSRKRIEDAMLQRIIDGRTDLVFEYFSERTIADATDANGVPLINWSCLLWTNAR